MIARSAEFDVVDADFGEALPVSLLPRVVLPALELEDDDFVIAAVLDDLARDRGSLDGGRAELDVVAVGSEDDVVELYLASRLAFDGRDADAFTRLGTK